MKLTDWIAYEGDYDDYENDNVFNVQCACEWRMADKSFWHIGCSFPS